MELYGRILEHLFYKSYQTAFYGQVHVKKSKLGYLNENRMVRLQTYHRIRNSVFGRDKTKKISNIFFNRIHPACVSEHIHGAIWPYLRTFVLQVLSNSVLRPGTCENIK